MCSLPTPPLNGRSQCAASCVISVLICSASASGLCPIALLMLPALALLPSRPPPLPFLDAPPSIRCQSLRRSLGGRSRSSIGHATHRRLDRGGGACSSCRNGWGSDGFDPACVSRVRWYGWQAFGRSLNCSGVTTCGAMSTEAMDGAPVEFRSAAVTPSQPNFRDSDRPTFS